MKPQRLSLDPVTSWSRTRNLLSCCCSRSALPLCFLPLTPIAIQTHTTITSNFTTHPHHHTMSTFSTEPTAASVSDPSQLITPVINQDQKSTLRTGVHVSWSLAAAAWYVSLLLLSPFSPPPASLHPTTQLNSNALADAPTTRRAHRLASLSLPLLLFPRLLSVIFASLLTTDNAEQIAGEGGKVLIRELNVLERSMAGFAGLANLALGLVLVVQVSLVDLLWRWSRSSTSIRRCEIERFRAGSRKMMLSDKITYSQHPFLITSSSPTTHTNSPDPPLTQSGALPLTSSLSASTSTANTAAQAPFRFPTIFIGSAYFFALAWFSYDLGFWLAAVPSGAVGVWGAWAVSSRAVLSLP